MSSAEVAAAANSGPSGRDYQRARAELLLRAEEVSKAAALVRVEASEASSPDSSESSLSHLL